METIAQVLQQTLPNNLTQQLDPTTLHNNFTQQRRKDEKATFRHPDHQPVEPLAAWPAVCAERNHPDGTL
jgi:hypothetical protein